MRQDYGTIEIVETEHDSKERKAKAISSWLLLPRKKIGILVLLLLLTVLLVAVGVLQSHHRHPHHPQEVIPPSPPQGPSTPPATDQRPEGSIPRYFPQKLDHFHDNDDDNNNNNDTWQHRYYAQSTHFQGPGHAIFLVIGGEGPNDVGMFYPFVAEHLASTFGAFVLEPEHRFYGQSQPILHPTVQQLQQLLTPHQALADMLNIVQHYRHQVLGCSESRNSPKYCPLITVGGSYPGFLSAVARLIHSDVVDMSYASSAPLKLYANGPNENPYAYYDVVTQSAERASPGCAAAVKSTLHEVDAFLRRQTSEKADFRNMAETQLNLCPGSIPSYITTPQLLSEELMQIIADAFADRNMFNYPPSNATQLATTCHLFQMNNNNNTLQSKNAFDILAQFWKTLEFNIDPSLPCFNVSSQLPDGPNATLSGSDWSGIGPGLVGYMWDYQCCTTLTPALGFSNNSMFPYRPWSWEWLRKHCWDRFQVLPTPHALVDEWHFDDLVGRGATRILFTNGLNDIWSPGSYLEDLSDSILAVNMPNGAHHSELAHTNMDHADTDDVRQAKEDITNILAGWLEEIKSEQQQQQQNEKEKEE